ncbi:MAG TPA: hypothetical protein VE782_16825, partial [Myxococcaceae bacterium]|nr:hypothetical protein [Myxococcaceae bacterium]
MKRFIDTMPWALLSSHLFQRRGSPGPVSTDRPVVVALGEDYPELRESVRRVCSRFPGEYWRALEDKSEYPTDFIRELTAGGFLAALI